MLEQYFLESIDQIKAIAEPTRWRMLHLLIGNEMTGAQLARQLKIPRPLAHYHLKILERTGLAELHEEQTRNRMIEKYYRAIAKQYLTDRLMDRGRQMDGQGEAAQQTVEAYSAITQAMLELVNADVIQPDAFHELLQNGFNYQEDVYLTTQEVEVFKQQQRSMIAGLMEMDSKNRDIPAVDELIHMRYTVFLTPAAAFDFDLPLQANKTKHSEPGQQALPVKNI